MNRIRRQHDERGMTTAEYAVGTVATVSIVGVLLSIINNDGFRQFLYQLIEAIIRIIIQMITGS
jgi:hypothetical protein